MARSFPVGQCPECLGWGSLRYYRDCEPCATWRLDGRQRAECRRCDEQRLVNSDTLCRPCLQIIRETDAAWLDNPVSGQPSQLALLMTRQYKHISTPLDRLKGRPRLTHERTTKWQRDQTRLDTTKDDPNVCPPAIPGQLTLVRPRRQLTLQHAQRIHHRPVRGYDQAMLVIAAHADQYGLSLSWKVAVSRMVRLALAIRDTDGDELASTDAVSDLPLFAAIVLQLLDHAALLQPGATLSPHRKRQRSAALPQAVPPRPRSCTSCLSWGFEPTCEPCRKWRRGHDSGPRTAGRCTRCSRNGLPLSAGLCRGCTADIAAHGPGTLDQPWTQLWLGGPLSARTVAPAGRHVERSATPPVSPALVDPAQAALFDLPRDWTAVNLNLLPALSERAQHLVDQFAALAADQRWTGGPRGEGLRTLRVLFACLGADAAIPETEIMRLVTTHPGLSGKRVITFLAERHLLVPDPANQLDSNQQLVKRALDAMPAAFVDDVRRWVTALRGEGRRHHQPKSWHTIKNYVYFVRPVLLGWQHEVDGLREITRDHVDLAIKQRKGNIARGVHVGLRSLFRALKQERVIFRDPTRGIVVSAVLILPKNIPSDRLRGLLDQAHRPVTKVVIALAAVHGLRPTDINRALLEDLDLSAGRLVIRRATGRHLIYLDELTHGVISAWLRHRHERWPKSTNPYLVVSRQTAMDARRQNTSSSTLRTMVEPFGVTVSALRADRILDEARQTADPVRLMRLFGICDETAMKYIYAAHPERRSEVIR